MIKIENSKEFQNIIHNIKDRKFNEALKNKKFQRTIQMKILFQNYLHLFISIWDSGKIQLNILKNFTI